MLTTNSTLPAPPQLSQAATLEKRRSISDILTQNYSDPGKGKKLGQKPETALIKLNAAQAKYMLSQMCSGKNPATANQSFYDAALETRVIKRKDCPPIWDTVRYLVSGAFASANNIAGGCNWDITFDGKKGCSHAKPIPTAAPLAAEPFTSTAASGGVSMKRTKALTRSHFAGVSTSAGDLPANSRSLVSAAMSRGSTGMSRGPSSMPQGSSTSMSRS